MPSIADQLNYQSENAKSGGKGVKMMESDLADSQPLFNALMQQGAIQANQMSLSLARRALSNVAPWLDQPKNPFST
jgi:hypothetical protein